MHKLSDLYLGACVAFFVGIIMEIIMPNPAFLTTDGFFAFILFAAVMAGASILTSKWEVKEA